MAAKKQTKDFGDFLDFDNFDLIGDPGMFGLNPIDVDNFDLIGDPGAFGLGGDDPYANWGGGADGDGTDGSSDFGSGGGGAGGLWNQIIGAIGKIPGIGGGGGTGGGAGGIGSIIGSLLPIIGAIGGGINQRSANNDAREAMLRANEQATNEIRGAQDRNAQTFLPYTDQGREAIWNMNATGARPLAGRYQPLGQGRGMVPSQTLGQLAKRGR